MLLKFLISVIFGMLLLSGGANAKGREIPSISLDKYSDVKAWVADRYWLQSADCARETGAILALCVNGKLVPLANVSPGDDPGHALALGLYSYLTNRQIDPSDISRVNRNINYFGIALLAALLYWAGLFASPLAMLTLGAIVANQYRALTPHPAQFGETCLAIILPIAILAFLPSFKERPKTVIAWIGIGLLALSIAAIFRQAIGLMGAVASILALGLNVFSFRTKRNIFAAGMIAAAVICAYKMPYFTLRIRDAIFDVQPTTGMEQHGIWHNLYIGLGVVENPFNIQWDDSNGYEHAREIDPTIVFGTPKYYHVLRDAYYNIIVQHPFDVAAIYIKKLFLALIEQPPPYRIDIWASILLLLLAIVSSRVTQPRSANSPAIDAVQSVCALFVCFFLGQAMLFHYDLQYLFPIQVPFIIVLGSIADNLMCKKLFRNFAPKATKI